MRLGKYFRKIHLPKALWMISVAVIVLGIGLAFYLDQLLNHNNIMPTVIGIFIFVFFCGISAWMLKKEPEANKKFTEKFLNNEVFPKCFECNKNNPDKLEKCASCRADLKIKMMDESTPDGILSFNSLLKEKPVRHSSSIIFCTGIAFNLLYFSILLNVQLLTFNWFIKDTMEGIDKDRISYLESKSDFSDGIIRYLIPRPGENESTDDSGKRLDGVPVYYNYYDKNNKGLAILGITLLQPAETLAIDHALTYNSYMSKAVHYKDFIKQNKDSMVMLAGPCLCGQPGHVGQPDHRAKVRIFPKCYFDQKVIVKLPGNADFQGTICGIETDNAGKITYAVRMDSQTVRKDIPEDNITLIPDEPKPEAPGVAARPRKK